MTPSEEVKQVYGLKSVAFVAEKAGIWPNTLSRWHKSNEKLFRMICLGVALDTDYNATKRRYGLSSN